MIRQSDFEVEIGSSAGKTFVRVLHKPTGNSRVLADVVPRDVGKTRDRFLAELRGEVFNEMDFRTDVGSGLVDGRRAAFIRVIHIPTGVSRLVWSPKSATQLQLIDEILDELHG